MNMFQIGIETIYTNILQSVLNMSWKPIVSYCFQCLCALFVCQLNVLQQIFHNFEQNCRILAFGWQAGDLPSIPGFSRISLEFPNLLSLKSFCNS